MHGNAPARLDGLPVDADALAALYRGGDVPDALQGFLRGRLLPAVALGPARPLAARLTRSRWFPWVGKVLDAREGANCLRGVGRRFPFEIRGATSVLDDRPCLVFDYDRDGNPAPVRRVFDELRRVGPGVYLGPAFLRTGGRSRLWLWYALAER